MDKLKQLKEDHINTIKKMIFKDNIEAFLQIYAKRNNKEDDEEDIIIQVPLNAKDDADKDFFVKSVIPKLNIKLKELGVKIILVTFNSEAWVKKINIKDTLSKKAMDNADVSEIVFISFSSENEEEILAYDIIQNLEIDDEGNLIEKPLEVDEDGDFIRNIKLELNSDFVSSKAGGGRFHNLYKKLTE
jgi:hypothetical protein